MRVRRGSWAAEHSWRFSESEDVVSNYVRYEVSRQNLADTLDEFLSLPRRVVDIGGGEGGDAAWLSNMSPQHTVVCVDPDSRSLGKAVARESRIRSFILGDSARALEIYGTQSFELVLSHGVTQYVDDPATEIKNLSKLLEPGGYLSLLTAGKFGKLRRYQNDPSVISRLLLDGKFVNNLGVQSTSFTPKEIELMLARAGLEPMAWFGVKVATDSDRRQLNEVPAFELNRLLSMELELSKDPQHRPEGQILHFIARKNT